jgi:hypothetical protein
MGLLLLAIGGGLFIASLAGSIAIYVNDRERRNGKGRSFVLFAVGALISGISGIFLFMYAIAPALHLVAPILLFMFSPEERSWVGAIVGVPASFAFGVAAFDYFWVRRGTP